LLNTANYLNLNKLYKIRMIEIDVLSELLTEKEKSNPDYI
jgi:hypothetical protein